ncbi:arsenate reductase [Advenella sp. S44]|uniref:Spx/MgsR family RNA polymerase-binding regulatory protein n=1 Tax=Advenella sp. S44 TaxID=1982755 RepID=UPI000C29E06F|nr:Spx/MgsR family RNA polymerase-binding regulatory protein [Advenella sp. S44]PJX22042.1 arsenate reductase [Advenella sp. S44]
MSVIRQYGLKRCSTCVKARKWLQEQGQQVEFTDYRDEPTDQALLQTWAAAAGGAQAMINRNSQTWRGLPENRKTPGSEQEWLALAAEFPSLIKRPVTMFADGSITFGFAQDTFAAHLS